jgi:hypothetical protein
MTRNFFDFRPGSTVSANVEGIELPDAGAARGEAAWLSPACLRVSW